MRTSRFQRRTASALVVAAATAALGLVASPAFAAEGSIDHVENTKTGLKILYSVPAAGSAAPDTGSIQVNLDGKPIDATAALASDAGAANIRRTTVLTIDVSNSMAANGKFKEAKQAAETFLDSVPKDVYVGIVTFASNVTVAQKPSLDRAASKAVIEGLSLSKATRLYDGVKEAISASGAGGGQRGVLLLTDGRDTTQTPLLSVTAAEKNAGVKVDVVNLANSASAAALLQEIATAGNGSLINANDPKALSGVFADEANNLARQILVTVPTPADLAGNEGTLSVSIDAGGQTYTDSAFVTLSKAAAAPTGVKPSTTLTAPPPATAITRPMMYGGLAAVTVGLLAVLAVLLGGLGHKPESVESRIEAYTRKGASAARRTGSTPAAQAPQGMTAQAVGFASKALESNRGLETALGDRLEAAGMSLKAAEWLLLHAAIAVGSAGVAFLLTAGNLVLTIVALLAGAVVPWFYIGFRRTKRLKAFGSQLAEVLQLMAGSLQAGLSLSQAIDTVVREGADPVAGEFRRALVETRLGVQIEDALESMSKRMESPDFEWTVMAIRIQREVGGNLAELLISVAATLREREYLRRQVKALSAEGRFSAYILLALPPAVMLYMSFTNPTYLHPLISTPIGFVMLGVMVALMVLGGVAMKKMIKLEV
ncbi:MAG: type II secretion system F family protein [Nocardioidaceae bacterium]